MRHLVASALLVAAAASPVRAQATGNGYMFGAPDARFSIHAGYSHAGAGSDLFDEVTSNLSLNKSDFSGPTIGGELAVTLSPRLDLALQVDYAGTSKGSEYRHFDESGVPIRQTTTFKRVPVTANLRAYLLPRGREIGKLAWIPASVVPWIGAGGGVMWYQFKQQGDFVDLSNLNIYADSFDSNGWAPTLQGMGGVDVNLSTRLAFTADLRYNWAR
ncbi:MAG: hypothetical protein ACJ8AD_11060, partial [Gemmatimonadaceae bacterium]